MNKTGVESGTGRLAFALMLMGCSLSALADGYVTLTAKNSIETGFAGAAWSETVEDPSTRDYLAAGFNHYGVTTTRTYDADANTATLHATLERRGIVLILR